MLLAQPLERLVLRDLHTCAHVAVAVHEEGESTRQVFAAWGEKVVDYLRGISFHSAQQLKKLEFHFQLF